MGIASTQYWSHLDVQKKYPMKKTVSPLVLALLAACCLNVVVAQENFEALTNEDILTLTAGGVSERVISLKIELSKTDFDTSAEALVTLAQAGAHEFVLMGMIQAAAEADLCADQTQTE